MALSGSSSMVSIVDRCGIARLSARPPSDKLGWVSTTIHDDRTCATGILDNRLYVGDVVDRSSWKRSAVDAKQRRW
jgi:hypothetical protein